MELVDTPLVPEIPTGIYNVVRRHRIADPGKPWEQALIDTRRAREADELKRYGRLRPTLSDNSLDPRVLARDIVIYNFGDARVLLSNTDPVTGTDFGLRRERILKDFATQTLKVSWDQWQTFAPQNRSPEEVQREVADALTIYLTDLGAARSPDFLEESPTNCDDIS